MKRAVRIFWRLFFAGLGVFVLLIVLAAYGVFGKMPSLKELENPSLLQTSEVYASDGTLMGKYYLADGNRSNVEYKDISKNIINALVATEDERFYNHSGIDFKGTLRAVGSLGKAGGGSTLTQQLAKKLLDQGERGNPIKRSIEKLKEWIIAVKLERNFTKEEIIALYLNAVEYSEHVFGIRNACRTFFQTEPDRVTVEQAALLVGMVNGPGLYNPRKNPKPALDRRNLVISRMAGNNFISETEAARLKALPIKLNFRKLDENSGFAPYFREELRDEVKALLKGMKKADGTEYNIYNDALKIYTTINPKMQQYAEEAVAMQMPHMQGILNRQANIRSGDIWKGHDNVLEAAMKQSDRWKNLKEEGLSDAEIRKTFDKKVSMTVFAWNAKREKDTTMTPLDSIKYHRQMMQASFMAMDPLTGEVKAWVGGISFKTFKFDHVNLNTKRQVGSAIKPFLYAQAIEERMQEPDGMVEDRAQLFPGYGWVPAQRAVSGRTMQMKQAIAYSKNGAAAYLMKMVGPKEFVNFLERMKIPTKLKPYPSNALGSCNLSLFEMLWGYTMFPSGGFTIKPYFISRIEDRNGNVIKRFDFSDGREEVLSQITAYKMCRMMEGAAIFGTAKGTKGSVGVAEMGCKTGTTNDNTDAWFIAYTPELLAGGWVGCDDEFLHLSKHNGAGYGGYAAAPVWRNFMKKVLSDRSLGYDRNAKFTKPADLETEISSADVESGADPSIKPEAEGTDEGTGNAEDFINPGDVPDESNKEFIPAESQTPVPDDKQPKAVMPPKDTLPAKQPVKDNNAVPIGTPQKEGEKKKGLINRIFGGKKNNN